MGRRAGKRSCMTIRRLALVAGLAGLLLAGAPGTGAREAADGPTSSGPLVRRSASCDENSDFSTGWSCSSWFELLPAETNATEDYSAYWVMLGIEPEPGWCATSLSFSAELPSMDRIVSAVPDRSQRFSRARTVATELLVDAEGGAPVPGRIWEDARIGGGRVEVSWGPSHYKYRWRGRERGRVYAVLGLQVAGERIPPHLVSTWAEGVGYGVGACKTPVIRTGP